MKLYVIRHGETDYNVKRMYSGRTDIDLNENGIKQAEHAAEMLADTEFDVIISSPLKRARDTAAIIRKNHLNIPVVIMDEFAERCFGIFEGRTIAEIKELYPEMWARNCVRNPDDAPENGESLHDVDRRVAAGLAKMYSLYRDKCVLLVCHGAVARELNRIINNVPFDKAGDYILKNCEVNIYDIQQPANV